MLQDFAVLLAEDRRHGMANTEAFVNAKSQEHADPSIGGHMIVVNDGHSIAMYERSGEWYVAEFRNGQGESTRAGAWFRSNAERLRHYQDGRAAAQSSPSLTPETIEKIARLHAEREARQQTMRDLRKKVATAVKRCLLGLIGSRRASVSETN